MTRHDDADQALVKINRGGRPPAFKPAHVQILLDIVAARPQASLDEIANELYRRIGLSVCTATIRRRLRAHGIVRLKTKRRPYTPAQAGKRYGYTQAHRREQLTPYSTDLTDAE
ncbi:Transposase, partial [Pseudomonas luteola]